MAGYLPQNRGNRSANRVGATVSRRLRAAGFNVVPSDRRHVVQCLTVQSAGDDVSILVDYGWLIRNESVSDHLVSTLAEWPQVSGLDVHRLDDGAVYINCVYTPFTRDAR